jgi:hypothetical protein
MHEERKNSVTDESWHVFTQGAREINCSKASMMMSCRGKDLRYLLFICKRK